MAKRFFVARGGKWVETEPCKVKVQSSASAICSKKPHTSRASAIHRTQVQDFNEAAQKAGTGAYYTPTGEMVCTSRGARNRELKRRGLLDKDGGYGDYTGT